MSRKAWAILALALVLRVVGIVYGLPRVYHQDEPIVVNHALAIGAEGWNTRTYLPPQFASYFLFFFYALYFVVLKAAGLIATAQDFGLRFLSDPTSFYLIGRFALGVLPGVGAVWLTERLGTRFFSRKAGETAALFLAVCLLHSQHSHYIYVDIPLSFSVLLLFYTLFDWLEEPRAAGLWKTGAAFGLSVAVKYTAVYFFPILVAAVFLAPGNVAHKIRRIALVGAVSLAVYAAISPYTFLDWPNFISQVAGQSKVRGYAGPFHHLNYSLLYGTGFLFLVLAAVGMIRERSRNTLLLSAVIGVYYAVNVYFSQPFARYMMPIVPFLCLFAALALSWIGERLDGKVGYKILFTLVILELAVPSVYSDYLLKTKDTRTQALEWIHKNIPQNSTIVVEHRFFGPPLTQTRKQMEEKYAFAAAEPGSAKKTRIDLAIRANEGKPAYNVYTLTSVPEVGDAFLFYRPTVQADWSAVWNTGAEYLVVNYSELDPKKRAFVDSISGKMELVAAFNPFFDENKKKMDDPLASTAAPHVWKDLFGRRRLGPAVEIYRIRR